jgi:hypothetical protein
MNDYESPEIESDCIADRTRRALERPAVGRLGKHWHLYRSWYIRLRKIERTYSANEQVV